MVVKICVVCGTKFPCYDGPKHSRGIKRRYKRRSDAITCSPKCSKIHYHDLKRKNTRLYKLKNKENKK